MIYRLLADLVLVAHLAFIVFVTVGVVLVLRRPRWAWMHVPCVVWGAWIEVVGGICPLTPLENGFRRLGGEAGYDGGFIDHHVGPIIYPSGLTRGAQITLGITLVVVNGVGYALILRRRGRDSGEVG